MPLSVCIITLDERENLPRCLASLAGLAAQIVVVDSHSRDGTQQLARDAGALVVERPFSGHVDQKSFALGLATEEWVLCLDADEWLDDTLRAEVARVLAAPSPRGRGTPEGYAVNRRTHYLGAWIDHCGWSPEWRLRLVRRGAAAWTGEDPHDRLELLDGAPPAGAGGGARPASGPARSGPAAGRLAGRLCHRPYRGLAEHLAKINRYTDTMAAARHAAGEHASLGDLTLRPWGRFARMYLLQGGFLDGWRGLVVSAMGAFYVFLKYAKLRALEAASAPTAAR